MGAGATAVIVLAVIAWFACMVLICAVLSHTTRPPWWESTQLDIESLFSQELLSNHGVSSAQKGVDAR